VAEWCASQAQLYLYGSHPPIADAPPPTRGNIVLGPLTIGQVAVRGGSWTDQRMLIDNGWRFWYYPSAALNTVGFRVVIAQPARWRWR
jgi:formylglycine-generating enzyme required for sulfatase activity